MKSFNLNKLQIEFIAGALIEYKHKYDAYSFNSTLDNLVTLFYEESKKNKKRKTNNE